MGQTIAEMLRADGRQEGAAEAKADSVLSLLRRLPTRTVPEELARNLRKTTDLAVLENWVLAAADARSVQEFRDQTGI